jgi:hypothetical protein
MLVLSMHASIVYWMRAAYRQNPPIMTMDWVDASNASSLPLPSYPGHARPRLSYSHHTTPHSLAQDGGSDVERGLDDGGNVHHHNARPEDGGNTQAMMARVDAADASVMDEQTAHPMAAQARARRPFPHLTTPHRWNGLMGTLLVEARKCDRLDFSIGLRGVRIAPDRSRWHSFYDPGKDEVTTEAKFWRESALERLHMFVHEIGHRGQEVDRSGYERFKHLHLNKLSNFESMANPVHLRDERAGHLHDIAEEVWAESYARWCLGLPMPAELKGFWDERNKRDVDGGGNRLLHRDGGGYASDANMALDRRTPADHLRSAFARLRKRWEDRFDEAAGKLARWFAQSAATRSDERLRRILRDGGLSVKFTPTKAMRDVMAGTVQANVALIKSIPEQYLTQVEGYVMRSVQTGRDLHQLSQDLQHELGVTKRRAAFISLDQNNKATSAMTRARQMELGLQAIWKHSHAGKTPRPSHVANDGKPYDPVQGWWDPHEKKFIWPGTLISCRCYSQTVVPGFKP